MRRSIIITIWLLNVLLGILVLRKLLTLLCLSVPVLAEEAKLSPNIVLFMADDMGIGDTSAYQDLAKNNDQNQIYTPQMERLARMGVRFSDAHTPASRCSTTRYGLLTGRYPWRNRLKYWVLFGSQGDPMIERDRPTIASMLQTSGYRTAMVGKWHVGLRYRQADGSVADGWDDADLTQPLFDTPLDHGFEFCRFTSRSHGTSGPSSNNKKKPNSVNQSVGPGHIHGRIAVAATREGKKLDQTGDNAYVLTKLGSRHSDHAVGFLNDHLADEVSSGKPFFLYYPSNSNHGPYTPDSQIGGVLVRGAARNVAGGAMDIRSDYVYENDVALGRLISFLGTTEDPRRPGQKLIRNTIMIFTSDNGAEIKSKVATGPYRSHKGSCYEGGHRVPLIVSWPDGSVGDGDAETPGQTNPSLVGLHDIYATLADVVGVPLPDVAAGAKGAEDSVSILAAWRGEKSLTHPMFFNDHMESKKDPAVLAFRMDDPVVNGRVVEGEWKLFFDSTLVRFGRLNPFELYELGSDPAEQNNRLNDDGLSRLVAYLSSQALLHRSVGGHRMVENAGAERVLFSWGPCESGDLAGGCICADLSEKFAGQPIEGVIVEAEGVKMTVSGEAKAGRSDSVFKVNARGLGIGGGKVEQVDDGESLVVQFAHDVIVESASIVAGNGACGGFYQIADGSPLAVYCIDADIDAKDQSGMLSDIGVVLAGQKLRFSSEPHYGSEASGRWRLKSLSVRKLK